MEKNIKVLIVDDSVLARKLMKRIIEKDGDLEVVGTAEDAFVALEMINRLNPDVLTLDVEMPGMNGITFLSRLMKSNPLPVVMVSSLTEKNADITLQAMELGAVEFLTKPRVDIAATLDGYSSELIRKIKIASKANIVSRHAQAGLPPAATSIKKTSFRRSLTLQDNTGDADYPAPYDLIAIGASTGGTEAIREILRVMPATAPAIVITQHIPEGFSEVFARRLDSITEMSVCQVEGEEQIREGRVYIAPGNRHLSITRKGKSLFCRLTAGEPVNYHIPSVDVLFRSVARHVGKNAIGVMLTGMGGDGADALREMRQAGALTIAQDKQSSVVWGMPGEAVSRGAVDIVLPLGEISTKLLRASRRLAA